MNDRARSIHEAAEDERNRHVRKVNAEAYERIARERARRCLAALVAPLCEHLEPDVPLDSELGYDGTGFLDTGERPGVI